MLWRKKNNDGHPHPGRADALDGLSAALSVERAASDAILLESGSVFSAFAGQLRREEGLLEEAANARRAIALASGIAATGARAGTFVSSLAGARGELAAAAGKHLPLVVHLVGRAMARHATSMNPSHDDYYAAADAGCVSFFAANPQQAADFAAIVRRVAERSLTPGICAQDLYETSHSVQNLLAPQSNFLHEYLGGADDEIDTPTPAQRIAFGEKRRRIPVLLDLDRPAGIGGTQDRESYIKGLAAGHMFFASHVDAAIDEALAEFGRLTGRLHEKVSGYRIEDARLVVVAQGSIVDELRAVVDYLRAVDKIRAGLIGLQVFRPFPGPDVVRMLQGKRVVTVLERTDSTLSEDRPLIAQVRAALDKAIDNGASPKSPPYADYVSLGIGDKPLVLSGGYGIGGANPGFAELLAVYRNMSLEEGRRKRFFVGADFSPDVSRFPYLETTAHQLNRAYPERAELSLAPVRDVYVPTPKGESVQVRAMSMQGAMYAMNLVAQALAADSGYRVKTIPEGGLEPSLDPARLTLSFAKGDDMAAARPTRIGAVLVSGERLLADLAQSEFMEQGGTLIVETNRDPATMWDALPVRVARWISEREVKLLAIDARHIATETASRASAIDELAVWALVGAWIARAEHRLPVDLSSFVEQLADRLARVLGEEHPLKDEIAQAVRRGSEEAVEVKRELILARESEQVEAPWTAEPGKGDETVFDPARFWRSVGYLYETGQQHSTLTDPMLATGVMPAGSSAFRDLSAYRIRIPDWLPENCTGCGSCWAQCPESALPPTVQPVSALIRTAMEACEARGQSMVQMNRIADHLGKQASRVLAKGGPDPYTSAAALLDVAFAELVERMNLDEKAKDAVATEFDAVRAVVGSARIAKTDVFFDQPNESAKDSGTLLSISLNPLSCTGCGICVDVCPDEAMQWVEQTPEQVAELQRTWAFQHSLPEVPGEVIDRHLADADSYVNRLLDKHAYQSIVGGDGGMPGNGVKTAVHLVTAAVESVMRPRFEAHARRLTALIERIESKIQGEVAGAIEINDFDAFGQRLQQLERGSITPDDLAGLASKDMTPRSVDGKRLRVLSDLLREIKAQREHYQDSTKGVGRARMILAIDTEEGSNWHGTYPYNPHRQPWIRQLTGDAAALSEGVFIGIAKRLAAEFALCRRAELELEDGYDASEHDRFFAQFDWTQFDDDERGLIPPVIVVGSPASTPLDGLQRLLSGNYPIKVAIVDSEGSHTLGAPSADLTSFALAQSRAFILQSSTGHPGHLVRGVTRAMEHSGPAFFNVYATDPYRSGVASEKSAEQARLACDGRVWPLFECNASQPEPAIDLDGNPDVESTWAKGELNVTDPGDEVIKVALTPAHWAVHESRFQGHFRLLSKGHVSDVMKPLAEYLDLDAEARTGLEPYVDVVDENGRHAIAVVAPEMVRVAGEAARAWRALRNAATGGAPRPVEKAAATAETPAATGGDEVDPVVYQRVADRLLQLCGYGEDPEFFKQSLRDFVQRETSAESEN